jgi:DNA modification methylase/superfamily II DNA or RNA helicase
MPSQDYHQFLKTKKIAAQPIGVIVDESSIHPMLYPFQKAIVQLACRKGRFAIFAKMGLGKTFMADEIARNMGGRALIVAPLAVARQTVRESLKIGLTVTYARHMDEMQDEGITITNYEMAKHFDPMIFSTICLDESSILKGIDGKTRQALTEQFAATPYRFCFTATPAPNDITEMDNHAEFLGIMPRNDMLAKFFTHDDEGWRLKHHAEEPFFRWLASWSVSINTPSDLGFSDVGYYLPPLTINPVYVETDYRSTGRLFFAGLDGVGDRAKERQSTIIPRVQAAAERINAHDDQVLVFVGLNDEGRELHKLIPGSVLVEGGQSDISKSQALEDFQNGKYRVLITKSKIAGLGMNFQQCHRLMFVGINDSFETYFQGIGRVLRYGQSQPVDVDIVLSTTMQEVYQNVLRKEREAREMIQKLIDGVQRYEQEELSGMASEWKYETDTVEGVDYKLMMGDSSQRLGEIADDIVGLSVFSPPFLSLYTYSPSERDLGNSKTIEEFYEHFYYIIDHLLRITMPGRNACVHVSQVPAMLARDGYIGMKDFRGETIRAFESRGWVYHGEVCIDKDPQAQAIRTKSKALLFAQLHKDSSWCRPAMADYILLFRKPGENPKPILPDLTNNEWIEWARPIWYGIKESNTLNAAEGRDANDERHIAPLQLGVIERCIRLWSNPGETVVSPFLGIGSEGHEAVRLGRRFIGCELKPSYFKAACHNVERAAHAKNQPTLFDEVR